MTYTYDPDHPEGFRVRDQVRLLINDVDSAHPVFSDAEIAAFLDLAAGVVLLAAAQALDTIADNEALTSKVLKTQDLQTDGAKVADSLRARARALRDQHADSVDDDGFFDIVGPRDGCGPELAHGWL